MGDEDDKPAPKKTKGTATLHEEVTRAARDAAVKAEADEDEAKSDLRAARAEATLALTGRAEAAERASALWFRLALALVAVLAMLVGGTVAVGAGVEIPGIGKFSVSKAVDVERSAPAAELRNEAEELPAEEP